MTYVIPPMTPIFDADCRHLGWFDGTHVYDRALEWIAFHSQGNVFTSLPSCDWLGPLHGGSFLDREGRPVAWLQGTAPQGGGPAVAPLHAMRPLRPKKPLRPRTPLFPPKPLTPGTGWSAVTWLEWTGRAPAPAAADAKAGGELAIVALEAAHLDAFFAYLDDHLADNGQGGVYFQPLSITQSRLPVDKAQSFAGGLKIAVPEAGWRRAWIARDAGGAIAGHIDLRGHPESFTSHRAVLGMGVHRDHRRRGLARQLLAHAEAWAAAETALQWIDLRVLAVNEPAVTLYRACGYDMTGGTRDRFVIDGKSIGELAMVKKLAR